LPALKHNPLNFHFQFSYLPISNSFCRPKHNQHLSLSHLISIPPPNADIKAQRLPEEALARLHLAVMFIEEIEIAKRRAHNTRQLHARDILPHAGPWTVGERDEAFLLFFRDGFPSGK